MNLFKIFSFFFLLGEKYIRVCCPVLSLARFLWIEYSNLLHHKHMLLKYNINNYNNFNIKIIILLH